MDGNGHQLRESWLHAMAEVMGRELFAPAGFTLPTNIRLTCGFPSRRSLIGVKNQRIGECWGTDQSGDNNYEIMVSPTLADPMEVAAVLAHELVHATVGIEAKHGGAFKKCAVAIGLAGKMPTTVAGDKFRATVQPMLAEAGPYPHAVLDARKRISSAPKKQGTRMLKCECPLCGYTVRLTAKWLAAVGLPHCPKHGEMERDDDVPEKTEDE